MRYRCAPGQQVTALAREGGADLVAVRWFSRAEIGAGLAGEGELLLPGTASIAHRLISDWFEGAR